MGGMAGKGHGYSVSGRLGREGRQLPQSRRWVRDLVGLLGVSGTNLPSCA